MSFGKNKSRNFKKLAALAAPLLALASCGYATQEWNAPSPWPAGYTYHNDLYKSRGEGKVHFSKSQIEAARKRSEQYNLDAAKQAAANPAFDTGPSDGDWDDVARRTLDKMLGGFGIPNEPVYVEPAGTTPRNAALEGALIRALKARTIPHTYVEGDGPFFLHYSITSASSVQGRELVTISLLVSRANFLTEATGIHDTVVQSSSAAAQPVEPVSESAVSSDAPTPLTPALP